MPKAPLQKNHLKQIPLSELQYKNFIYDGYSAILYGNILNIIKDEPLTEKIFIEAFLSLVRDKQFRYYKGSLSLYVCMFAKRFTAQYKLLKNL